MKIYVGNIFLNHLNDEILIKKVTNHNNIYSSDGIFLIRNNELIQLVAKDKEIEKFSFDKYNFLVDRSEYIFRKNIYNIPYNHIVEKVEKVEYKHNEKSQISMIIENKNGKRSDLYFETREKELYKELKQDIIKYLSLFKEY